MTTDTAPSFALEPLSVHLGAEISGLDLRQPLPAALRREVWEAMLAWKVIFFRDQLLDHAQHVAFARQFGDPTPGHVVFGGLQDFPEVYSIAKHRTANSGSGQPLLRPWTGWHTDITAAVNPPGVSILRGDILPPYGGDTQWTNLAVAYEALSPPLRTFIDRLTGIHRFAPASGRQASPDYRDRVEDQTLVAEHPLVRLHPETGERILYISPGFLKSIVDLTPRESQGLLELLWEHAVRPEFTVRFQWASGSVAMWDNRSTAHLAPRDIFATDFDRQLWRVTLGGEIPVGVDGVASRAIAGAPIPASRAGGASAPVAVDSRRDA